MVKRKLVVGHIYPKEMNVYGDIGNIITLRYRLQQRGIGCIYKPINRLSMLKNDRVDFLVGGGGQDSNQADIQADLQKNAKALQARANDGMVCLMICGMYQLFGNRFITDDGTEIIGAGVLDLETIAGGDRLIGNLVVDSQWGRMVGFENHSGRTQLGPNVQPLGSVLKGAGNNGTDKTEGVVVNNVFGTYMHGPVLAKNPQFADELIKRALVFSGQSDELSKLDDELERRAADIASKRPR